MPTCLRLVVVVAVLLSSGLARAQECGTGAAPACNGTCPDGFVCAPGQSGPPCECLAGSPLDLTKLSIKLHFAKQYSDTILVNALIPIPDGYTVAGRMVRVDVGGVTRTMVVDAKGIAKSDGAQVKLGVRSKKGVVAAQNAKLFFKLSKGTFADALTDEGLANADLRDAPVEVAVSVTVDTQLRRKPQPMVYKATQGKTGKASQAK